MLKQKYRTFKLLSSAESRLKHCLKDEGGHNIFKLGRHFCWIHSHKKLLLKAESLRIVYLLVSWRCLQYNCLKISVKSGIKTTLSEKLHCRTKYASKDGPERQEGKYFKLLKTRCSFKNCFQDEGHREHFQSWFVATKTFSRQLIVESLRVVYTSFREDTFSRAA